MHHAARLHLAKVWTSSHPPKLPITVVTHTQTNRDKNINQCRTWRGPLVASVYMPIAQTGGTELGELQKQQVQSTIDELDILHEKYVQWGQPAADIVQQHAAGAQCLP